MNIKRICVGALSLALSLTVILCGCQSKLLSAVQKGDLEALRHEIAIGATQKQLNEAADIAYTKGHTEILNEFAKAGVAVAPDNIMNKEFVIHTNYGCDYGDDHYVDAPCFDSNSQTDFEAYWPQNAQWVISNDTIKMTWRQSNPDIEIVGNSYDSVKTQRYYKRIGRKHAEIFVKEFFGTASVFKVVTVRYQLEFSSATQGHFKRIIQAPYGMSISKGSFVLQNIQ